MQLLFMTVCHRFLKTQCVQKVQVPIQQALDKKRHGFMDGLELWKKDGIMGIHICNSPKTSKTLC